MQTDPLARTSWSAHHTRRHPRDAVLWSALLYCEGVIHDCAILNISAGGAKLSIPGPISTSALVTLTIFRYGDYPAQVVWQYGSLVGLRFLENPRDITRRLSTPYPETDFDPTRPLGMPQGGGDMPVPAAILGQSSEQGSELGAF